MRRILLFWKTQRPKTKAGNESGWFISRKVQVKTSQHHPSLPVKSHYAGFLRLWELLNGDNYIYFYNFKFIKRFFNLEILEKWKKESNILPSFLLE